MIKILYSLLFFSFVTSQFSLYKGNDYLRFTGNITTYYHHRFYLDSNPLADDGFEKNRFGLKDAQFQLKGYMGGKIKYELQMDFAKFKGDTYIDEIEEIIEAADVDGDEINLEDDRKTLEMAEFKTFIMDAYASYKIEYNNKLLDNLLKCRLQAGFFKIPFTRNNFSASKDGPWIDRADTIEDALFRRDLGIMLTRKFFSDQLTMYFAMFNGRGEVTKNNDNSGKLEYVARLNYTFGINPFGKHYGPVFLPGRMKYKEIDFRHTPIPTFAVGLGAKFSEKKEITLYDDDYLWPLSIDGTKKVIGFDLASQFQGLSIQYDYYLKELTINSNLLAQDINNNGLIDPVDGTDEIEKLGYKLWQVDEYNPTFKFSGQLFHMNYYFKKINLVAALRWEEIMPNSIQLNSRDNYLTNLGIGFSYLFNDMYTAFKIQYIHRFPEGHRLLEDGLTYSDGRGWKESELRMGIQFLIR